MRYKSTFVAAVLVMCASFAVAHADVKYTRVVKTTFPKTVSHNASDGIETDTYFVTPDKVREETESKLDKDSPSTKSIVIKRYDQLQVFTIDDNLKIYSVYAINKDGIPKSRLPDGPVPKDIKDMPETKMDVNFSVQKLGPKKINGFDTQGYLIVTSITIRGYTASSKIKKWLADVPGWQAYVASQSPYDSSTTVVKTPKGYSRSIFEATGDVAEMNKISGKFEVRSEGTIPLAPGTGTFDATVTSFERIKKLDDSLFEVPAGYRKVSENEYAKLEFQAKKKANH